MTKPASGYPSPQTVRAPTTSAPSSPGGRTVTDKEYFVWDDQLKGFGARVYPNGNKRYVAQTFRRGKTIRVQIGRHGALPFEEAKARARKIIADIDDGRNPNREKEAERLSPTMAQLAERFLEEYVPSTASREPVWSTCMQ